MRSITKSLPMPLGSKRRNTPRDVAYLSSRRLGLSFLYGLFRGLFRFLRLRDFSYLFLLSLPQRHRQGGRH